MYTYRTSRAGAVADELVGAYDGVLVTDGYAAYDHLACSKQRCWTHILRTAREIREKHPDDALLADWVSGLKALYAQAKEVAENPALTLSQRAAANDAEKRIRQLGLCYSPAPTHPAHALAQWLHRHQDELFTFVRVPGVAGTNNLAERTVRPQVIARKISGGSRSARINHPLHPCHRLLHLHRARPQSLDGLHRRSSLSFTSTLSSYGH